MQQPDGSVKDTKISIPNEGGNFYNLPYFAGKWGCQVQRTDSKTHTHTQLWVNCYHKEPVAGSVAVKQVVPCNHPTRGKLKGLDIKDNYVILILGEKDFRKSRRLHIWCKL